jgi:dTDP-6-deoxy-L-talose 4-dehydrogenase (NAD+)
MSQLLPKPLPKSRLIGEPREKLCTATAQKLLRGEAVELLTPWSNKDYIHVRDLARAICLLLEQGHAGAVNLGTGRGVRVVDLVRIIARGVGVDESLVAERAESAAVDHAVADVTVLRALGFEAEVSLDAGIQELVDSLRRGDSASTAR